MIKRKFLPSQLFPQQIDTNEVFLPQEIIENIFKFLNKKSFFTARLVCHKWEEISNFYWQELYQSSYSIYHTLPNEKEDWKNMFFDRSKILRFVPLNIKKSKSLFKTNSETHLNKGFEHLYRLEYEKALESFARAAIEKENARAYEGLTRVYFHRKNYTNVLIFAEHCLKLSPINPGEIFYMRGKAFVGLNRLKEALKDYESSIKYLGPVKYVNLNTSEIYIDKMHLNLELGNYDACLIDCKNVKTKYSEEISVDPFFNCAKILFDKKLYTQAERFLPFSTTKSKEFYLLSMRVQVGLGNYEDALEFFCKYEEKLKIEGEESKSISNETYLDIGITLFMNYEIKEGIEYFQKSFESSNISNETLKRASKLTFEAANSQIDNYDDYFMTIHISWSFYYFFSGLVGYFTSCKDVSDGRELCLNSITNFTRSITLNPTLPESFFYRAVLRCYLDSTTEKGNDKMITEKPSDDEKRKTKSGRNTRRFNAIIGTKIVTSNLMKESLNDLMNSNALATISLSKHQSELPLLICILKSYVLLTLQREKDALTELEKSKSLDKEDKYIVERSGLNAAISKEEKDILVAFELEYKKKEINFPSFEDKFSHVLIQVIRNLKYKKI